MFLKKKIFMGIGSIALVSAAAGGIVVAVSQNKTSADLSVSPELNNSQNQNHQQNPSLDNNLNHDSVTQDSITDPSDFPALDEEGALNDEEAKKIFLDNIAKVRITVEAHAPSGISDFASTPFEEKYQDLAFWQNSSYFSYSFFSDPEDQETQDFVSFLNRNQATISIERVNAVSTTNTSLQENVEVQNSRVNLNLGFRVTFRGLSAQTSPSRLTFSPAEAKKLAQEDLNLVITNLESAKQASFENIDINPNIYQASWWESEENVRHLYDLSALDPELALDSSEIEFKVQSVGVDANRADGVTINFFLRGREVESSIRTMTFIFNKPFRSEDFSLASISPKNGAFERFASQGYKEAIHNQSFFENKELYDLNISQIEDFFKLKPEEVSLKVSNLSFDQITSELSYNLALVARGVEVSKGTFNVLFRSRENIVSEDLKLIDFSFKQSLRDSLKEELYSSNNFPLEFFQNKANYNIDLSQLSNDSGLSLNDLTLDIHNLDFNQTSSLLSFDLRLKAENILGPNFHIVIQFAKENEILAALNKADLSLDLVSGTFSEQKFLPNLHKASFFNERSLVKGTISNNGSLDASKITYHIDSVQNTAKRTLGITYTLSTLGITSSSKNLTIQFRQLSNNLLNTLQDGQVSLPNNNFPAYREQVNDLAAWNLAFFKNFKSLSGFENIDRQIGQFFEDEIEIRATRVVYHEATNSLSLNYEIYSKENPNIKSSRSTNIQFINEVKRSELEGVGISVDKFRNQTFDSVAFPSKDFWEEFIANNRNDLHFNLSSITSSIPNRFDADEIRISVDRRSAPGYPNTPLRQITYDLQNGLMIVPIIIAARNQSNISIYLRVRFLNQQIFTNRDLLNNLSFTYVDPSGKETHNALWNNNYLDNRYWMFNQVVRADASRVNPAFRFNPRQLSVGVNPIKQSNIRRENGEVIVKIQVNLTYLYYNDGDTSANVNDNFSVSTSFIKEVHFKDPDHADPKVLDFIRNGIYMYKGFASIVTTASDGSTSHKPLSSVAFDANRWTNPDEWNKSNVNLVLTFKDGGSNNSNGYDIYKFRVHVTKAENIGNKQIRITYSITYLDSFPLAVVDGFQETYRFA